jgi:hypothetical protein
MAATYKKIYRYSGTGHWILDTGYWILDTGYWIKRIILDL